MVEPAPQIFDLPYGVSKRLFEVFSGGPQPMALHKRDEINIEALLAEFKEHRRRKAKKEEKDAKKPFLLKVKIPQPLYAHCAQASAQIGISLDEFVTDVLSSAMHIGDEEEL